MKVGRYGGRSLMHSIMYNSTYSHVCVYVSRSAGRQVGMYVCFE